MPRFNSTHYDYGFHHASGDVVSFSLDSYALGGSELSAAGVTSWVDAVIYGLGEGDDSAPAYAGDEFTPGDLSDAVLFATDTDAAFADESIPGDIADVVIYDLGDGGDGVVPTASGDAFVPGGIGDAVWDTIDTGTTALWPVGDIDTALHHAARSDFNGDGTSDILLANYGINDVGYWDMAAPAGVVEPQYNDMGWFSGGLTFVWGHGDYNGDGFSDVLWFNVEAHAVGWTDMNGGVVSGWNDLGTYQDWWISAGDRSDLTGDGSDDIIFMNFTTGELGFYDMDGGQPGAWHELYAQDFNVWQIVGGDDFNGDGTDDILWHNTQTDESAFWLMDQGNVAQFVSLGAHGDVVATGDFMGDGSADILWSNGGGIQMSMVENGQILSTANTPINPSKISIEAVGDYNGNGVEDFLFRLIQPSGDHQAGDLLTYDFTGQPTYFASLSDEWHIV